MNIDTEAWEKFFAMRELVNTEMDVAKKDKIIGSSVAASVTIPDLDMGVCQQLWEKAMSSC
ncbi:MAG: hypothetical protein Q9N62_13950 [Ghiorsea sp.]|nr:hypothetical protein [Ghiorsea sp.]